MDKNCLFVLTWATYTHTEQVWLISLLPADVNQNCFQNQKSLSNCIIMQVYRLL